MIVPKILSESSKFTYRQFKVRRRGKKGRMLANNRRPMRQDSSIDFQTITTMLLNQNPFYFIRFSDGELEIIHNHRLYIGENRIVWSKGEVEFTYPDFDKKDFLPQRDAEIREDLLESAKFRAEKFFKGIPTTHNNAVSDRNLLIELNGGELENMTFADLFINENFRKFRRVLLPLFLNFENVFYFGNFRAKPELVKESWKLIPVSDNFFPDYASVLKDSLKALNAVPRNSLVLASASSLTNIVGHRLAQNRDDITFFDVGTSIHDLVGLQLGIREYHALIAKNSPLVIYRKLKVMAQSNFRLKW